VKKDFKEKLIKVEVQPNANCEEVIEEGEKLKIRVREKAENGKANKRVFKILSFTFPKKRIELVKGFKSKNKIFKIYEKKN